MSDLEKTILKHCPGLSPSLVETHFLRMPESYAERFSPTEIARHLRLIDRLSANQEVEVEVKPLGGKSFEVCVVGIDRTGVLAAITTALASDGFDVQDLHLSTYLPDEDQGEESSTEPARFVDVARVVCRQRGRAVSEMATDLRDRLSLAFRHLAEGDFLAAQSAVSDSRVSGKPAASKATSTPWVVKEGLDLGDFRLESKIATGGMSEIYLATQKSLGRKVAVKIVSDPSAVSAELMTRFEKEVQVLGSFASADIVQVMASGTIPAANGTVMRWLAMEYMPNGDLASWIKRHGPPSAEVGIRWFLQVLQGLLYAHHRAILHRDLKPHNLLLSADYNVKISDFGLLKDVDAKDDLGVTVHGTVMGTPQYLPPEQALAEEADERSDIYSLGASFFHLFSGRLAFEEKSATAFFMKITQYDPPGLLEVAPEVPRPLAMIVNRMMARKREDRYQDVRVILEDLKSYLRRGLLTISEGEELRHTKPFTPDVTQVYTPTLRPDDGL